MRRAWKLLLAWTVVGWLLGSSAAAGDLVQDYTERYLQTFPTQATAAGRTDLDARLERLDAAERAGWLQFNTETLAAARAALAGDVDPQRRIDLELLARQARQVQIEWGSEQGPTHDPLFWTEPLSAATLYLVLRTDRPARQRLDLALARTRAVPRLVATALTALSEADPARVVPERAAEAALRLRALAEYYREGLPAATGASALQVRRLKDAGRAAAEALLRLAVRSEALAATATADFRLRERYVERFRVVTGIETPLDQVLADAWRDLASKRQEAAAYGRGVWAALHPDQPAPLDDAAVLRQLYAELETRRPSSTAALVAQFNADADAAFAFARAHALLTLPEPRTLVVGTAPAWLGGQSVGGVYPAGPYQPDAETLFLLPNIADDAPEAAKARFYSAFNTGFNRMITAHELVPGHYVQLKVAARQPHAVRSLFGDGVYTEGWGSFAERLMLDLGWGGVDERLAHYKKQQENIARLIADISVHTQDWDQARLARFLADDALLDAQFAANLWKRAQLSSPQLTTYQLGYRDIHALWLDWRTRYPDRPVAEFVDGMLAWGAIPVRHYRAAFEDGRWPALTAPKSDRIR